MPPARVLPIVNLLFDNRLCEMLTEWKTGVSWREATELLNAELARRCERAGIEPIWVHQATLTRYGHDECGIE